MSLRTISHRWTESASIASSTRRVGNSARHCPYRSRRSCCSVDWVSSRNSGRRVRIGVAGRVEPLDDRVGVGSRRRVGGQVVELVEQAAEQGDLDLAERERRSQPGRGRAYATPSVLRQGGPQAVAVQGRHVEFHPLARAGRDNRPALRCTSSISLCALDFG